MIKIIKQSFILIFLFFTPNLFGVESVVLSERATINHLLEITAKLVKEQKELKQIIKNLVDGKEIVKKNTYIVTTHFANLRVKSSLTSRITSVSNAGSILNLKEINKDWFINEEGFYIHKNVVKKINLNDVIAIYPKKGKNIRTSPDSTLPNNIKTVIKNDNEKLIVYATKIVDNNWYKTVNGLYVYK